MVPEHPVGYKKYKKYERGCDGVKIEAREDSRGGILPARDDEV